MSENQVKILPRGLGALHSPEDRRDQLFRARMRFGSAVEEPGRKRRKHYTEVIRMDQGNIGQCTMASAAHIVAAGPITQRPYYTNVPHLDTISAYCRAQQIDQEDYGFSTPTYCRNPRRGDTGATMRSAAKVLRELKLVEHFWWMMSGHEARVYLTNVAPLWFASWWYSGMSTPDANGFVWPTGQQLGGHAYVLDEIAWQGKYVWLLNSWGTDWGHRGRAKMTFEAMDELFNDWGEGLGLTEVRRA